MSESYRRMDNSNVDPFHIMKEKIQTAVRQLEADMATWRELLRKTNTYSNPAFQRKHNSVAKDITKLKQHIKMLHKTIKVVEKQRSKFSEIDDNELQNRKDFLSETKAVVDGYKKLINDPTTKRKRAEHKQKVEDMRAAAPVNDFSTLGDHKVAARQEEQEQLEAKADIVLDDMQKILERLGGQADTLDIELAEQKDLISEMGNEVEIGQSGMKDAIKKMKKLLGTSSNSKLCCLFIMFLMVLILLFLAVVPL
ncbi:hypothetical protein AAMO2058_000492000 [Amorphochlora amoebiformis]